MFRNFANQVHAGKLNDDWPMWGVQDSGGDGRLFEIRPGESLNHGRKQRA